MSEQAKTELSMRDRLIRVLLHKCDVEENPCEDWADSVVDGLVWAAVDNDRGRDQIDAIKFIFDTVDGPPMAYSAFQSAAPLQSNFTTGVLEDPQSGWPFVGPQGIVG